MANPLTTTDIENLTNLLRAGEKWAFGRGVAPTNSGTSSIIWKDGTKYVTFNNTGHNTLAGYASKQVYDPLTHNTPRS